jgi:nucleoside-diphosphate-sugar epimerase
MEVKGVLITGVSGFLGKVLVDALHEDNGIKLFGHSRHAHQTRKTFEQFRIEIIDRYDATLLDHYGIHTVIHLAGIAHDLSNQYKSEDYFQVNDLQTRLLYDFFLRSKARKFIFLSSIKAAVDTASSPVDESVACSPVTPYGQSKRQAEEYIERQPLTSGKQYYILRPCMIHGPGNKGNLNLLYRYVKTGVPYPLGAFHNQRSFLHSDNFTFVAKKIIGDNIASGIYHLADTGYLSTTELYKLIAKAIGKKSLIINIPAGLIKTIFRIIGKSGMLKKLTESMMVSNKKLLTAMAGELPVKISDGITKTINTF